MNGTAADEVANRFFASPFENSGFEWALVVTALVYAGMALVGLPLNFIVCYITYKYRNTYPVMGSNTGVLIALNSFFEMLHQSSHFTFLAIAATGTNHVCFRLALFLEAHSIVGANSAYIMLPFLSVDRLLAVSRPIFYNKVNQHFYLSAHLLAILLFNLAVFYAFLEAVEEFGDRPVTGCLADLYAIPSVRQTIFYPGLVLYFATVLAYFAVGIIVKCRSESTSETMQRLYRSLFLIVGINVGGYFIFNLVSVLYMLSLLNVTPRHYWYILQLAGCLVNLSVVTSGPILYHNSNEYRTAFLKEFGKLSSWWTVKILKNGKKHSLPQLKNNNTVVPIRRTVTVASPRYNNNCPNMH